MFNELPYFTLQPIEQDIFVHFIDEETGTTIVLQLGGGLGGGRPLIVLYRTFPI